MKAQRIIQLIVLSSAVLVSGVAQGYSNTPPIDPGYNSRIIDDSIFLNTGSMSVQAIQNFLNGKVPSCDTNHQGGDPNQPPPYKCLKDYVDPTTGKAAAQLIYDEATSVGLNPQVVLVTLQKEQGLVTDTWPYPSQYQMAMGYGCPESQSVCDSQYFGFYNQVHLGVRLLRAGEARDCGDTSTLSGWTIASKWQVGNTLAVDGRSTLLATCATGSLYNYTPHRPDSAYTLTGGVYYYGNYNFVNFFNSWFGSTWMPELIKSVSAPGVYLYTGGYKIAVPSMALLQDYGFDPNSIATISQASLDSIPAPSQASGISPILTSVLKTTSETDGDGAAVYAVSVGKKYPIASMQQFADFGFNAASISYLPEYFVSTIQSGQQLSNFIQTRGSTIFQVSAAAKRIIFDYQTYRSLDPSDAHSPVSTYFADTIASGVPITNQPVLVKELTGAVDLLNNGAYYSMPSMDVFNCWGFQAKLGLTMYSLASSSDVAAISPASALGCLVTDGASTTYLLGRDQKYKVPSQYSLAGAITLNADNLAVIGQLPTATSDLKQAIKTSASAGVWFIENGARRLVPSMSNFNLLHLTSSLLDTLDPGAFNAVPASGIKLGTGQAVKAANASGIFVISGNTRILIPSAETFGAYGYQWPQVESYPDAVLDQYYPYNGVTAKRYLYSQANNQAYLVDPQGCYKLTSAMLTDYGQDTSTLTTNQTYDAGIFTQLNLGGCTDATNYAQPAGQNVVYWVKNNTKQPFSSWSGLLAHNGGSKPNITRVSSSTLDVIPTGPALP